MKHRKILQNIRRVMAAVSLVVLLCALCGCKKENSRVTKETEDITFGIDVAKYQGTIDWKQVAESSVDFAMVRVGYRAMGDGVIKEDSNARYNLQEASRAGIPLGAYFFSTAVTEEEAMEEAAWTAKLLSQYPVTYPVVYDCEGFTDSDSRQFHLTKKERTNIALAFLETIEKKGYEGMFYASKNDMQADARWEVSRIQDDYKIWVAQYPDPPYPATQMSSYSGTHQMWQYSMSGTVPGITQPVDLDIAYFGYDGIEPPKNPEPPAEAAPDVTALMDFREVQESVTAKEATRLRNMPSQEEDSMILFLLENGEIAQRIAISSSGWSKLIYNDVVCYAVSSYLTTDLDGSGGDDVAADGIQTQFSSADELVTAKVEVNLRMLPSVEHEDAHIVAKLKNGDTARRIGISDNGWSMLEYNGTTCYAVSSYLTTMNGVPPAADPDGIRTEFEEVYEKVTAKDMVNLRSLPSTEHPDVKVVAQLYNGEIVIRTGINRDLGWSRVVYNGQTLYCVSSYLKGVT